MAKPTLTEYKESKGYLDYLKSTNTDKKAFDTLSENEQLQILEKYFKENNKRVRVAKKAVTPIADGDKIAALITKVIASGNDNNAKESIRILKELQSLNKTIQAIKDTQAEIERKQEVLTNLKNTLADTLAKYEEKLR